MNLSSFSAKVLVTSLLVVSTTGLAFAKGYGYKGENYKGEAMPAPCPPPVMLKDGFYVGAQVGYDSYRIGTSTNIFPFIHTSHVLNARGWVGGLFLGYGKYFTDVFYLGGEVFGNYSNADVDTVVNVGGFNFKHDIDVRGSWGLSLLPGVRLNDTTLGYIRVGYTWARFDSDEFFNNQKFSKDSTEGGWHAGLGLETLLYENWSLRTEYTYTSYDDFKINNNFTKITPYDNQFMVGLIYHFA